MRIAGFEHLVGIGAACNAFDEVGDDIALLVAPGLPETFPVTVEVLLHDFHFLTHSPFSIFLHACIERGVDFEPVLIGVEVRTMLFQIVAHGIAEVEGSAIVGTLHTEVEAYGKVLERVERGFVGYIGVLETLLHQTAVLVEVLQHHVAALEGVVGIDAWVVGRSSLEQSDQHGSFLGLEV